MIHVKRAIWCASKDLYHTYQKSPIKLIKRPFAIYISNIKVIQTMNTINIYRFHNRRCASNASKVIQTMNTINIYRFHNWRCASLMCKSIEAHVKRALKPIRFKYLKVRMIDRISAIDTINKINTNNLSNGIKTNTMIIIHNTQHSRNRRRAHPKK